MSARRLTVEKGGLWNRRRYLTCTATGTVEDLKEKEPTFHERCV